MSWRVNPNPLPGKIILVDGHDAGRLMDADEDCLYLRVWLPYPPLLAMFTTDPLLDLAPPWGEYQIDRTYLRIAGDPMLVRIGFRDLDRRAEGVAEHVPTALAQQKIILWSWVVPTRLDETDPIETAGGDPTRPCETDTEDYFGQELRGYCTCGWSSELIPAERGSQLARALRRHLYDLERRRHTEDLPICILEPGAGPNAACVPTIDVPALPSGAATPAVRDEYGRAVPRGWVRARCQGCGWCTAHVPPPATGKLMALADAHLDQAAELFQNKPLLAIRRARLHHPNWHFANEPYFSTAAGDG